ncbi:histidinol-phosphate transaminase [Clostridium sp. WLY-B-L2]|jgi:histidinol-phosphate aminotransferase|uniref:Histidinol-phosphate aminotransferase n=1 Tax=Clostridium aromativorans TaxID=2836848 RepID=A0ABS8N988_9CLOT|nr:histidinol-phosphate transaminase [Clostridium aromativorans]MCC9295709.1 histidinol-phosphate transaminase [Clostridium aromativorans]CAB1243282.1 Histidinol-phosphate aminotransferase [Clostridiaceae bacterium BL-3]
MSKYWSKITRNVEPYVCGEQPKDKKYVKLNTNESPYAPSPKVLNAIRNAADGDIRLYPDPSCDKLRETISSYYGLNKSQVFVGNGSDEVLAMSFLTFFDKDEAIVFPDISYSFYPVYANLYGIKCRLAALNEDFSIPVEEFLKPNGGIVIPNPNAPTGKCLETERIKEILKNNGDKVVIIDEAYVDFGGNSVIGLIKDYPNLLVVRTLSKSRSLAGLRVGFALGQEELIDGLNRIKDSFNSYTVNRVSNAAAIAALEDEDYFKKCVEKIINTRESTVKKLRKLGFKVVPSKSNFIFITHPLYAARELFMKLREKGVLVRYFDKDRIDNYMRVSIGSDEDMDIFIEKIREIIGKGV